jgi:hypothetical protein
MLEVHDYVGMDVHLLTGEVYLLAVVVPPVLGLTEKVVRDLQQRRKRCRAGDVRALGYKGEMGNG